MQGLISSLQELYEMVITIISILATKILRLRGIKELGHGPKAGNQGKSGLQLDTSASKASLGCTGSQACPWKLEHAEQSV